MAARAGSYQPPVSVNATIQKLLVFGFFAFWSFMLLNIAFYLFMSADYTNMKFWYVQALIAVLPGLMFALAWWCIGRQKALLHRLFLASLIAFLGFMLTTIVQQLTFLVPAGTGGRVSETAQIVEPLVVFVVYLGVIIWAKKVKK